MNRDSYNAIAPRWDEARVSFIGRERMYVETFLQGLSVPSSILDLGCGSGRPIAEHILERGHYLTGVDQSVQLLDLARSRLPKGVWIESSIEDFESGRQFDGVVCWDALFHVERSSHELLLARIAKLLRDDGRFMLTVGGSDHPAFTDTMFGETFFYDSHPPDKVLSILRGLRFEMLVAEFMNEPTGGRDKGRYAIVARKNPDPR